MNNHRLGIAIAAGAALLLSSACSSGSTDGGTPASGGGKTQTLRVGVASLAPGQGNPFTATGSPSIYTWSAIFDALTLVDAKGTVQSALATSWEQVEPTRWRFTLREGVKFSNGEVFDASAVIATIDHVNSEAARSTPVGVDLMNVSGAKAVDPRTVEVTTAKPDPILPKVLSELYIVAPKAWQQDPKAFANAPVGTGSFKVDSITQNRWELSANPDSWRKPKVDKLQVIKLPDAAARLQALQSGQIEVAIQLNPDQIEQVRAAGGTPQTDPAPQVMSLAFYQTKSGSKVADQKLRQALNYAVDKQAIVTNLTGDLAKVTGQGASESTFGYDPQTQPYPYDPEKAKELLKEAGHDKGLSLTADVVVGSYPADDQLYQAVAADLAKVGVTLTLRQMTFAEWLEKYQTNGWSGDMFGLSWNSAPWMDAIRAYRIFSCAKATAFFCDKSVMPLIEQANNEFDEAKRLSTLQELARKVHDNPPSLYLVQQTDVNATAKGVQGYLNDSRFIHYEQMTVGG
ncbi:ABC transporter substrate-binding protein [Streptosporangium sp. NPDC002544]|uniref:ABC transporter substrate-binding protein n=1 Tax=unclassified Streptosporangium TaxID=2632669 RepID=UPI00332ECA10